MAQLQIPSLEAAVAILEAARAGDDFEDIDSVFVGPWIDAHVKLEMGLHSEMTPPFMEAFLEAQAALYRLAALVKYDAADIRHLTQADLDEFQIRVKVTEGSSDLLAKMAESVARIAEASLGKLSPKQTMLLVAGLAVLLSGSVGFGSYLTEQKEIRLAEIQGDEKKQTLDALTFSSKADNDTTQLAIKYLAAAGSTASKAVDTAHAVHAALLKAASQTPESTINGQHITRQEARDLRSNPRRPVTKMIVEREMRVVDINTSDPAHTVVVVEDADGGAQYRLQFADRLIQDRDQERLFASLRARAAVWLRLDMKDVGGELRVVNILGVVDAPAAELADKDG